MQILNHLCKFHLHTKTNLASWFEGLMEVYFFNFNVDNEKFSIIKLLVMVEGGWYSFYKWGQHYFIFLLWKLSN